MAIAVFPGSFDPPTYGHLNVIERAAHLFERIDVVIAVNPEKSYTFSAEERLSLLSELTAPYRNVCVHQWGSLIVDYCRKVSANVLIRGVRNAHDFSYEFDLSLVNSSLDKDVQTLFLPTDQRYVLVRSSNIKELAKFGGDISGMVPPSVENALKARLSHGRGGPDMH
ncbi:MAG: pantetheine-phosphate adenylyltransferase [Treponema sp.]|nr:pantetheine-phosphate adenylyltransferase [Treponema sp.]